MNFRTEINFEQSGPTIDYQDPLLFMGSCFSVNIHTKLHKLKFNTISNPFGIVYNPISLSNQLNRIVYNTKYELKDLQFHNERWFSFDHHSDFSFTSKTDCLSAINDSLENAHNQLKSAKFVFLTLGSSWIYHLNENNSIVSNCHKLPSKQFTKSLVNTSDIVDHLSKTISKIKELNPATQIIFSVSPVRHLADGFFENQVSKGRLFDAIYQLIKTDKAISYFPAFEMVLDDLRDYRFYKSDLTHPSNEAITYIWEKFVKSFISNKARTTLSQVEKIIQAANHRPFNSSSKAHQEFQANTRDRISKVEVEVFGNFENELKQLKAN